MKNCSVCLATKLGWTPLMMAEGIFVSAKKEFPAAASILRRY
jgi:hypothetical protein